MCNLCNFHAWRYVLPSRILAQIKFAHFSFFSTLGLISIIVTHIFFLPLPNVFTLRPLSSLLLCPFMFRTSFSLFFLCLISLPSFFFPFYSFQFSWVSFFCYIFLPSGWVSFSLCFFYFQFPISLVPSLLYHFLEIPSFCLLFLFSSLSCWPNSWLPFLFYLTLSFLFSCPLASLVSVFFFLYTLFTPPFSPGPISLLPSSLLYLRFLPPCCVFLLLSSLYSPASFMTLFFLFLFISPLPSSLSSFLPSSLSRQHHDSLMAP